MTDRVQYTYIWQAFAVIMSAVILFICGGNNGAGFWSQFIMGAVTAVAIKMNYKIFCTEADKRKQLLAKKGQ